MQIRRFKTTDTKDLVALYYNTIHKINSKDYSPKELEAWAPTKQYSKSDYLKETNRWERINPFIAEEKGELLGFAELEDDGHINCFFVHHEYQGQGVGKALLNSCINLAKERKHKKIVAEVSLTSLEFFENSGFKIIELKLCEISGVYMKFYEMEYVL